MEAPATEEEVAGYASAVRNRVATPMLAVRSETEARRAGLVSNRVAGRLDQQSGISPPGLDRV